MFKTMMMVLKMVLAAHGSDWCQVDSVENNRAVVVCKGDVVRVATVNASLVGGEGTDYGTVWTASVTAREGGSLDVIKL